MEQSDDLVRKVVYDVTLTRGFPPSLADAAKSLGATLAEARAAFRRLADAHVLVLQPDSDEILMANPFSAVPTPFVVELDAFTCFGNCIWDALGIGAMMKRDARIKTSCGDCSAVMELRVADGVLQDTPQNMQGLIHFALPARRWWDDIVFN
jgi:hypothetical protein